MEEILSENDTNFQTFLNLFELAIVSGQYQKFGEKSTVPAVNFKKGDFVLVIFESQKKRCFGILQELAGKKHQVDVKILRRRTSGDNSDYTPVIERFSTRQLKLIFRPK